MSWCVVFAVYGLYCVYYVRSLRVTLKGNKNAVLSVSRHFCLFFCVLSRHRSLLAFQTYYSRPKLSAQPDISSPSNESWNRKRTQKPLASFSHRSNFDRQQRRTIPGSYSLSLQRPFGQPGTARRSGPERSGEMKHASGRCQQHRKPVALSRWTPGLSVQLQRPVNIPDYFAVGENSKRSRTERRSAV